MEEKKSVKKYHIIQMDVAREITHGVCVSNLAWRVGKKLSLSEDMCYNLAVAGFLHDIGKLEMAKYVEPEEAAAFTKTARQLLKALTDTCLTRDPQVGNGVLKHGTYCKKSEFNTCPNLGVDEYVSWGDYFYMEALTRLTKDWELYW